MLLTWSWVLAGMIGIGFAILLLREVLADWQAAKTHPITQIATMFLHETIRATWFRLATITSLTLAGLLPALIPLSARPPWVRLAIIGLLILGEVLLTVDTGLRLRSKRRMLGQLRKDSRNRKEAL